MLKRIKQFFADKAEYEAKKKAEYEAAVGEATERLFDAILTSARIGGYQLPVYIDENRVKKLTAEFTDAALTELVNKTEKHITWKVSQGWYEFLITE